jgi:hypothetical protein
MTHTVLDRTRAPAPPGTRSPQPSPKGHLLIDRRALLQTAFGAVGAYAVSVSGVTWLVGPRRAWAMEFQSFDPATADTLLQMARALYPHEKVGDAHYAEVVKALDGEVADQVSGSDDAKAALALYQDGAERLNAAAGGTFKDLDEEKKEELLKAEEASDAPEFFQAVRGKVVGVLYNQPAVWEIFGYQGPSYEEGGYLYRGFDDLSWLPDPPDEASPPAEDA